MADWRGSAVAAVPVSEAARRRSVCAPASAAARVPLQRKAGTKQSCKNVDDCEQEAWSLSGLSEN